VITPPTTVYACGSIENQKHSPTSYGKDIGWEGD